MKLNKQQMIFISQWEFVILNKWISHMNKWIRHIEQVNLTSALSRYLLFNRVLKIHFALILIVINKFWCDRCDRFKENIFNCHPINKHSYNWSTDTMSCYYETTFELCLLLWWFHFIITLKKIQKLAYENVQNNFAYLKFFKWLTHCLLLLN